MGRSAKNSARKKFTVLRAFFRAAPQLLTERLEEANLIPRAFVTVLLDKGNEGDWEETIYYIMSSKFNIRGLYQNFNLNVSKFD